MKKKLKKLPKFKNEDEEREFWATHDSTEYLDWSKAVVLREPMVPRAAMSGLLELSIPHPAEKRLTSLAAKLRLSKDALARKYILEGIKRDQQRIGEKA